jgi:Ni/Fe-hydrogenase subunit HybB-like protein
VHFRLWQTLSRAIGGAMAGLVVLRLADLYTRDSLASAFTFSFEAELFWMEMALFAAPVLSAFRPFRESPAAVYLSAVTVLGAFLFARLNLSLSALDAAADAPYFPTWAEAAIALSIIALAAALSGVALRQPLRKAPAVA